MGKNVQEMSKEELARGIEKASALLEQIEEALPGLLSLTREDRKNTDGRIRGEGEPAALRSIVGAMAARPEVFAGLAARDGGKDPKKFETAPLAAGLEKAIMLHEFSERFAPVAESVSDTALLLGERVKPTLLAGYQIAKNLVDDDEELRSKLREALDYWAELGRKSARARAAQKAEAGDKK